MKTLEEFKNYGFTKDGDVYNIKYDRKLKPYFNPVTGYLYVSLKKSDGVWRPTVLHRIIAKCFVHNPDNLPQVNHVDGDKLNNHYKNLEWVNNKTNIKHAYDNNLIPKGEDRYNNVNPVESIHNVCQLLEEGLLSLKEIENSTGVNAKSVGQIKSRKQWKDISKLYNF